MLDHLPVSAPTPICPTVAPHPTIPDDETIEPAPMTSNAHFIPLVPSPPNAETVQVPPAKQTLARVLDYNIKACPGAGSRTPNTNDVPAASGKATHGSDEPSLRPLNRVGPAFSPSICTLSMRRESVPNAHTTLLRPELPSNHPLHLDMTSSLLSISQHPDAFNSPAPSGSHQDYHTPTPSFLV